MFAQQQNEYFTALDKPWYDTRDSYYGLFQAICPRNPGGTHVYM